METLAEQSGDVETLVEVKSRDLSSAYKFLKIAEVYKKAGKNDKAFEWAEHGVKAFPEKTDSRLREFLAKEYQRLKRHGEAINLIWAEFSNHSDLENYQLLKKYCDRAKNWSEWRDKALALIRERIQKAKDDHKKGKHYWWGLADNSVPVSIFLWEKDIDKAWHEAVNGGCSETLWLKLAKKRESDHPEDALKVYKMMIDSTLARKNKDAYKEAVNFLKKIKGLMHTLGKQDEFPAYLESVRKSHKPKRNFIKLLNVAKWD